MEDINYNDNNRIVIRRENFEQIILNVNNKDIKYTFMNLNEYILFLKIIMYENNDTLFKKVEDIKKEYKKYDLKFDKDKFYEDLKNVSLILGGTIGFAGLSVLLIPTIFGISALGPIAGGLFAYLQSIGITLSIIQSISMTGLTITIGTCTLSGASIIILPGLIIKKEDIIKDEDLKQEIERYINNKIN